MKFSLAIWRYVVNVKWTLKILSIFVAFSENVNFTVTYLRAENRQVFFSKNNRFSIVKNIVYVGVVLH